MVAAQFGYCAVSHAGFVLREARYLLCGRYHMGLTSSAKDDSLIPGIKGYLALDVSKQIEEVN